MDEPVADGLRIRLDEFLSQAEAASRPFLAALQGLLSAPPSYTKHIKGFKRAWQTACDAVGLGEKEKREGKAVYRGLLFHDLRRSAVRNLIRSGVPERVAMAISGHKTRSIFDRYNITSESDLEQAARSLDAYHASVGTNLGTIEGFERALEEVQGGK